MTSRTLRRRPSSTQPGPRKKPGWTPRSGVTPAKSSPSQVHTRARSSASRGRGDSALRVRDRHRDGPTDRHRRARPRQHALPDQRAWARDRSADRCPDAGDDDRPGRWDRLRALHRHPAQAAATPTASRCGESIARATATAGGAVVFAGITVVIALCSLLFAGIPLVANLGYTAAIAVGGRRPGAVTLLPALLGALGPRINSLRVKLGRTHPDDHQPHGWARWARAVAARPWRSLIASTRSSARAGLPGTPSRAGAVRQGALPKSTTARQAYDAWQRLRRGCQRAAARSTGSARRLLRPGQPNKINDQQKKLDQQKQQIEQQVKLQGARRTGPRPRQTSKPPRGRTSSTASAKRRRTRRPTPASPTSLTPSKKAPDVKSVSPPTLDKGGRCAVYQVVATRRRPRTRP